MLFIHVFMLYVFRFFDFWFLNLNFDFLLFARILTIYVFN